MTDIKALLKQYKEANAELNKQIQQSGNEFIQQVFQEVFDQNEGLKFVYIIGWTPGFNDGDVCTHSQETYVGVAYHSSWAQRIIYDFEDRELFEDFGVKFDDNDNPIRHINSECKTLEQVIDQISAYDELIERVFNTNFELKVSLNDEGKVVVDQDWYYCGY